MPERSERRSRFTFDASYPASRVVPNATARACNAGAKRTAGSRLLPVHYVSIFTRPASLPIAAEGREIIARRIMLAGTLVRVRPPPRIIRDVTFDIRPTPVERHGLPRRHFLQGIQPLLSCRIRSC